MSKNILSVEITCKKTGDKNNNKKKCWCIDCKRLYFVNYYIKNKDRVGYETRVCIECGAVCEGYKFCSSECKIKYKTQIKDDCLIWLGRMTYGYPYEALSDMNGKKGNYNQSVRRWLYKKNKKQIGYESIIVNTCGNNLCVNTEHSKCIDRIDFYRKVWNHMFMENKGVKNED